MVLCSGKISIWRRKMAEKATFHGIDEIFIFCENSQNNPFLTTEFHFLHAEFPFSERRILGGLIRTPLQCLRKVHKLNMSVGFGFSEHRILVDLFSALLRATFAFLKAKCRSFYHWIWFFWVQNFHVWSAEFWSVWSVRCISSGIITLPIDLYPLVILYSQKGMNKNPNYTFLTLCRY